MRRKIDLCIAHSGCTPSCVWTLKCSFHHDRIKEAEKWESRLNNIHHVTLTRINNKA
ncbi:hypothetical protein KIN20_032827 [Parelaphostrongylus tenuis]|uniref:Uncharacterized protein n=1 Tax=Parelaphostrongylus tenuis TaxID=148309 RepID=A0AAD5WIS1_PARTN|nr:hypothetical protein KIN20_032827 [Parelaphostrongylus tenuis]